MNKQKAIIATISTAAVIGVVCVGAALFTGGGIDLPIIGHIGGSTASSSDDGADSYIAETCYDGTHPVDKKLFQIAFKKTDYYVSNKDLVASDKEMVQLLESKAKDFIETLLGTGYREVDTEGYSYADTMSDYFWEPENSLIRLDDEAGTEMLYSEYLEQLGEYISEHKVQADVTFETDDSLVYQDGHYYVRGKLTVTSYNFEGDDSVSALLPYGVSLSEENTCIFEVELKCMASESDDYYFVTGFEKIADF